MMGQVLGVAYGCTATRLAKKAGFSCKMAHRRAVTLIQRFGSALNLNIRFHMLLLDGVYLERLIVSVVGSGAQSLLVNFRGDRGIDSGQLKTLQ